MFSHKTLEMRGVNMENCPIFGDPCESPNSQLPTYNEVILCYLWHRSKLKTTKKAPLFTDGSLRVKEDLKFIGNEASIPAISDRGIIYLLQQYYDKYNNVFKSAPKKGSVRDSKYINTSQSLKDLLVEKGKGLFNIAACQCKDFSKGHREKFKKIPIREREFILDQRGPRKLKICEIDIIVTHQNILREQRKRRRED